MPTRTTPKPSMQKTEKRILVVDDDEDYRATIRDFVAAELGSARVIEANTAEAALDLLKRESFDLIISDYRLPRKDGAALLIAASNTMPTARFLMLSAEPDLYLLAKAGCPVLTKPVQPELLKKTVRNLLKTAKPAATAR